MADLSTAEIVLSRYENQERLFIHGNSKEFLKEVRENKLLGWVLRDYYVTKAPNKIEKYWGIMVRIK